MLMDSASLSGLVFLAAEHTHTHTVLPSLGSCNAHSPNSFMAPETHVITDNFPGNRGGWERVPAEELLQEPAEER